MEKIEKFHRDATEAYCQSTDILTTRVVTPRATRLPLKKMGKLDYVSSTLG